MNYFEVVSSMSISLKRFIGQTVYTMCTRIKYKIVPVTNLNKYLHYGTSGTEKYVSHSLPNPAFL